MEKQWIKELGFQKENKLASNMIYDSVTIKKKRERERECETYSKIRTNGIAVHEPKSQNYWGEIIQTQIKDVAATIEDSVKHTDLYLFIISDHWYLYSLTEANVVV